MPQPTTMKYRVLPLILLTMFLASGGIGFFYAFTHPISVSQVGEFATTPLYMTGLIGLLAGFYFMRRSINYSKHRAYATLLVSMVLIIVNYLFIENLANRL